MANAWHLAQINVGKMVAPQGDPVVQPFFDALDAVNALAEASPGFVWRLVGEGNSATDIHATVDPLLLLNMSVWTDADSLFGFVYRSGHTPVMAQRRNWFARFDGSHQALWWIPAGTIPTINDGLSRLGTLDRFGPTPHASPSSALLCSGSRAPPVDMQPDPLCVGTA